jgi:formylmethanofuran dehydrogenase subunit E
MKFRIIGTIHSPYKTKKEAPPQGWFRPEVISEIEIFKEHEKGLKDIENFSHLIVLYYLHKSDKHSYLVKTPWDIKTHGLFTTRSPNRPNPIGFSVVKLVEKKENKLKVKGLDAIDDTPLLDIKPYLPNIDAEKNAKIGWLGDKIKKWEIKK